MGGDGGPERDVHLWVVEEVTPVDLYHHGVTRLVAHRTTRYQEMLIVESGAQGRALVLDGKWQSCEGDEFVYHEALVHPAMIDHGGPRKVLVLGGGEGATVREALRWETVERVVMVDIDGEVVEACREHLPGMHRGAFDDPRTELVIGDAVEWLEGTEETWDVVISDLSDPLKLGPSFPLFTREFFAKVDRVLAPEGRFVLQAGPVSPGEVGLHAALVNTVAAVFPHVASIAAPTVTYGRPWGFALAARHPLELAPDPEAVDALLAERTNGGLRLLDGTALGGLLRPPAYVRRAIAEEERVFSLEDPPRFETDRG